MIYRSAWLDNWYEHSARFGAVRNLFAGYAIGLSWIRKSLLGNVYESAAASLWCEKILRSIPPGTVPSFLVDFNRRLEAGCRKGINPFLESYGRSKDAHRWRKMFRSFGLEHTVRLKFPRPDDEPSRQGDLIILKPAEPDHEKGVVLLKYNDTFLKFTALFNVKEFSQHYRIVLEPSTWGYMDSVFLLFLGLPTDVIIQCQDEADYQVINSFGQNLIPLSIGAGDWVDSDMFRCDDNHKEYDVIMVASWLKLKRHSLLFRAVSQIRNQVGRIACVGYPGGRRTVEDVKREAARFGVLEKTDFFERIPPRDVRNLLCRSKVSVMLSRREGAMKSVYESFFSNIPVVLSAENVGFNKRHITPETGIVASDHELSEKILYALRSGEKYRPREWALKNTGYKIASERLNTMLRAMAAKNKEPWSKDIVSKMNRPNLRYVREEDRLSMACAYDDLSNYLIKDESL